MSCLLFNILKEHCKIFRERYLTNTLAEDTFKNIIFRHLFIVPRNAYCLQSVIDLKTLDFKEYGSAVFAFKSLLNHSCSPNTVLVPMGSTIGTVTIKNIEAGGQIFGNYGPHHKILWREFRQDELQAKYNFLCQCVACVKNFPTYRELPPMGSHPQLQLTLTRELQQTKRISLKTAKKSLQKAIDYIQRYKHLYPIRQLCDAEEEIKFCYDVMARKKKRLLLIIPKILNKLKLSIKRLSLKRSNMGNMAGSYRDSGEPERESHELYSKLCHILGGTRTEAKVFNDLRRMRENEKSWKTSHSKQIDYVFKLLQQYNLFPDFAKHTEEKNDRKSEKFRQKGNFFFNSESYVEAIAEYNRSICYAVTKENISIALGNRSAAFYRMKMFRECLESIRLAREFGYPDRLEG
uniref:SET domain-containing protein n=1 Tax=Lutzomyia longipalpis TaxID=7200 RepID=A0A1B0GHJ6_LUTLO